MPTDEEIFDNLIAKAEHWEREALINPECASVCLDYAKHTRTMAECVRLDILEKRIFPPILI